MYKFPTMNVSQRLDLFDKLITPILGYCSEVWGYHEACILEKIHLQFLKQMLGVRTKTQNNFVYGEVGRFPLQTYRIVSVIRYWLKIVSLDNRKLSKIIYDIMLQDLDNNPRIKNWASNVQYILQKFGFNHVWLNQVVENNNLFLRIFKQRVKDNFIQNWQSQINDSTRAQTYTLFAEFAFQTYLDKISVVKYRYAFTWLRTSSHRLEIETGRWTKPNSIPRSERKCQHCNILEDEFHFLLECPLYHDFKINYIKRYFWKRPNILKFIELLQSKNTTVVKNLSTYIYKSMNKREHLYYFRS